MDWDYEYSRCGVGVLQGQLFPTKLSAFDMEQIEKHSIESLNEKAKEIKRNLINENKEVQNVDKNSKRN